MELIKRLEQMYGTNEPIFLKEIKAAMSEYSSPYIFQCIRKAIAEEKLLRFDEAIYYIPTDGIIFKKSSLNLYKVIYKKYMRDEKNVIGFFTGWKLLNLIGGTTQVPFVLEVATNKETMKVRKALLGSQKLILRKPKCKITNENEKTLQILELANQLTFSDERNKAVVDYARMNKVTARDLLRYSQYYPAKTMKNMRGVLYELA